MILPVGAGDSCGCAMGAKFLAIGLVLAALWYGWQWYFSGVPIGVALVRILLWSILAAFLGKLVGLVLVASRRPRTSG